MLQPDPPPPPKSRKPALLAAGLIVLLALAGLLGGRHIINGYYYVSAHHSDVAIMRGIQGSFLGVALQKPYQFGCINSRGELSQISYGQADTALDCALMKVQDLRPSERAAVTAGLPAGSLDQAISQLRELARDSLLPMCPPPAPPVPAVPAPAVPRGGTGAPSAPPPAPTPAPQTPAPQTPAPQTMPAPQPKPGTDCRTAA